MITKDFNLAVVGVQNTCGSIPDQPGIEHLREALAAVEVLHILLLAEIEEAGGRLRRDLQAYECLKKDYEIWYRTPTPHIKA